MKKALMLIGILFIFTGNAWADDGKRWGAQFESGGNLGLIYYGDDYGWAAGGGMGFSDLDMNQREVTSTTHPLTLQNGDTVRFKVPLQDRLYHDFDELSVNFFIRKNFKIHDKTYVGLGVTSSFAWGGGTMAMDEFGLGNLSDVEIKTRSFSVAPYFILDYHVSPHIVLNAGATIVTFKETRTTSSADYTDEEGGTTEFNETLAKTTAEEYFNPFFGLTYLF